MSEVGGILKLRKARWAYECRACLYEASTPDLFRALEAKGMHERTITHTFKMIGEAFQPVVDAYAEMARAIIGASEQFQKDFALLPPANIPHDPTLLRDRRKWGGR